MGSRVVFWDFDGTLAQRRGRGWSHCLTQAAALLDASLQLDADDVRRGLQDGFPWHDHASAHPHLADADSWWQALTPLLIRAYRGAGLDERTAAAAAGLVRATYTDPAGWTVYPDTRPALGRLQEHGWRHVILSNHVPELPELVGALGLSDLVETVITSAAIGWEKPHPQAFRHALAVAGEPEHAVMVGDNPAADVGGATNVGIPAILVRSPGAGGMDLRTAAERILAGPR